MRDTRSNAVGPQVPTSAAWITRSAVGLVVLLTTVRLFADALPAVSNLAPVPIPHFPDALHAVVWRNWGIG